VKAAEPPKPLVLSVDAGRLPATVIEDLKRLCEDYPGDCEVVLEVHTRTGPRRLKFGQGYRVAARNASLKAELERLLGQARPLELASA
jgi:DNA polymerase-3 subunit alpha